MSTALTLNEWRIYLVLTHQLETDNLDTWRGESNWSLVCLPLASCWTVRHSQVVNPTIWTPIITANFPDTTAHCPGCLLLGAHCCIVDTSPHLSTRHLVGPPRGNPGFLLGFSQAFTQMLHHRQAHANTHTHTHTQFGDWLANSLCG